MRSIYITLGVMAAMLSGQTMTANGIQLPTPSVRSLDQHRVAAPLKHALQSYETSTRSYLNPELTLDATYGESWDYRDLRPGSNAYEVFLSNLQMVDGLPVESGQYLCIVLFAPDTDSELPPAGVYEYNRYDYDATYTFGSNLAYYRDVFPHPEDPEAGLVCYEYDIIGGTVTVEENEGVYTITADLTGSMDEEEEEGEPIKVTYTGELTYVDPNPYEPYDPLEGDVELTDLTPSGRYEEGMYNIAFYNVPLDEEGFIIGPGDLMNVELYVDEVIPMNMDDLCGTFTPVNVLDEGYIPGRFMQGIWYNYYGWWLSLGTYLNIYKEDGSMLTGLAEEGDITISREGDIFTVEFNLVTPEEHHITGTWTGPLADYITDFTDPSAVSHIGDTGKIAGGKGCVKAPEGARIFSLSGLETSNSGLMPGIYLVKYAGKTTKVVVK